MAGLAVLLFISTFPGSVWGSGGSIISSTQEYVLQFVGGLRIDGVLASAVTLSIPDAHVKRTKYLISVNSTDVETGLQYYAQVILIKGNQTLQGNVSLTFEQVVSRSDVVGRINPRMVFIPTFDGEITIVVRVWENQQKTPKTLKMVVSTSQLADVMDAPKSVHDLASDEYTPVPFMFYALAKELGNTSVALYEFVRNNVLFDAYWGVMRGPIRTYYDLYGNSFDQSSLLVALLRATGTPARYVYGLVGVKSKVVMDTLGVWNKESLLKILTYSYLLDQYDPSNDVIWLRHSWVRAFVNNSWVDMDPSFKKTIRKTSSPIEGVTLPPVISVQDEFEESFKEYMEPLNKFDPTDVQPGVYIIPSSGLQEPVGERVVLYIGPTPPIEYVSRLKFEYPAWTDSRGYDFVNGNHSFTLAMPIAAGYRITARFIPADRYAASYIASQPNGLLTPGIDIKRARVRIQFLLNGVVLSLGDPAYPGYYSPLYITHQVQRPNNSTYRWTGRNFWINGYMSYVPSFVKTRFNGEMGIYASSIFALTLASPELLKGMDIDEVVGRFAYVQGRLYRIGSWHLLEELANHSYVFAMYPFTITQSSAYIIGYDGRKVYLSNGGIHAQDMIAAFMIVDPFMGEVKLTREIMFKRFVYDSLMEGVAVYRSQQSSPFSTSHSFYYALTKGGRVLFATKDNVTALQGVVPQNVYNRLVELAAYGSEFYAYIPSSPASFDVLRVFATNSSSVEPIQPVVASDQYAYLYMIPNESPWEWDWGTIIQGSSDVVAGGGTGTISETNRAVAEASADSLSENTVYSTNVDETSGDPSQKLLNNYNSEASNEVSALLGQAIEAYKKGDADKFAESFAEANKKLEQSLKDLQKDLLEYQTIFALVEGKLPVYYNPDGGLMTYSQVVNLLAGMDLPKDVKEKILDNQQKYLQAYSLGYVEFNKEIDGEEYLMRVYYQTSSTYSGQGLPPLTPSKVEVTTVSGAPIGKYKIDNYDSELTKIPTTKIEFNVNPGTDIDNAVEQAVKLAQDYNGKVVSDLVNNYAQKIGAPSEVISTAAGQWIASGVIFVDPPFLELALEDSLGNIAGYHPDHGTSYSENALRYSGYGSFPKVLETFAMTPGVYFLNVYGTDEKGVDAYLHITYNWGNTKSIRTIPVHLNIGYGELVKIPVIIDNRYQLSIGQPLPGLRLNFTVDKTAVDKPTKIKGKVFDQFGSNGVPGASISISIIEPDGQIRRIANITTEQDGTFSYTLTPSKAGINYVHIIAGKEGFAPAYRMMPLAVHANLIVTGKKELVDAVKGMTLKISLPDSKKQISLKIENTTTTLRLPAGTYILTIQSPLENKGWKLETNQPIVTVKLKDKATLNLEELYTVYVQVKAETNIGQVDGSGFYKLGAKVTLKATAPQGYVFKGWTGDITSDQNPLTFTAEKPVTLRALWEPVQTKTTTITPTTTATTQATTVMTTTPPTTKTTTQYIETQSSTSTQPALIATVIILAAAAVTLVLIRRFRRPPPPPPPPP